MPGGYGPGYWTPSGGQEPSIPTPAPSGGGGGQQGGPGHPGGYDPNKNLPTKVDYTTPAPPVYNLEEEKQDYWDKPNAPSLPTVPTQATLDMQTALALKDKYGEDLSKWSDKDLMQAQASGLFQGEAEGMLGGVTGYEQEVNLLKKAVNSKIGKMNTQGLNSNQFKTALQNLPEFQSLSKLHGYKGSMEDIFDPTGTASGSVGNWIIANTTQPEPGATGLANVGYDPSGTLTWGDVENDPYLYESYNKLMGGDLSPEELKKYLTSIGYETPEQAWQDPNQGRYSRGYGRGQRGSNLALLRALRKGSPIKQLEKSPFMSGMVHAYAKPMKEAGEKGIFSKTTLAGLKPKDMQRLIKSWGSGYSNPLYANVAARGGIMSAWNNMRR